MGIYNGYCDFNKYRMFYAVAEAKSFSKAAETLFVSQPAVSHAIKELEDQLEVKLFVRNGKNVLLTEEGEKLMKYVQNAFDNIVIGERLMKESKEDLTGKIRIGIYSHMSTVILPKVIKKFNELHPKARFVVFSATDVEMKEKFKNRELDILILHYPVFLDSDIFTEEKLLDLESGYFGNKYYYDDYMKNKDTGKKLEYPLILPMKNFMDTIALEECLKKNNTVLKPVYRAYSTEFKKELAKEGLGICWVSKICVEKELETKELYEIPLKIDAPKLQLSVVYDDDYLNPTARAFLNELKSYYKKN